MVGFEIEMGLGRGSSIDFIMFPTSKFNSKILHTPINIFGTVSS